MIAWLPFATVCISGALAASCSDFSGDVRDPGAAGPVVGGPRSFGYGGSGNVINGEAGSSGSRVAQLPEPLTNMAVVHDPEFGNGKLVVFGGTNAAGMPSKAVYSYDPKSNAWTRLTDMPTARTALGGAGCCANELWYAVGGFDANGNGLTVVEAFDPLTNKWSASNPLPTARGAFAYAADQGGGLVAGGAPTVNGGPLQTTAVGLNQNQWMSGPNMTTARAWAAGVRGTGGGGVYVIGGAPAQGGVEFLRAGAWVTVNSMPTGRGHLAAASATLGRALIFAAGGSNGSRVLGAFEAYDPDMQAWTQLPPMPTPREGLVAVVSYNGVFGQCVITIGGDDGASPPHPLDTVEIYSFKTFPGGDWH